MNRPTRDAQFLNFTRGLVAPAPVNTAPLEVMEAEARRVWPGISERGSLRVLARRDGDFIYEWGNATVSRHEASIRAISVCGLAASE
jgi:hypothetical protein